MLERKTYGVNYLNTNDGLFRMSTEKRSRFFNVPVKYGMHVDYRRYGTKSGSCGKRRTGLGDIMAQKMSEI